MSDSPYLFHNRELRAVISDHEQAIADDVEAILPDDFLNRSPDALADEVIAEYTIDVPVLRRGEDDIVIDPPSETKIDVSHDPMRMIFDRTRPAYLDGTEYTFHVPFQGDPHVFEYRPSTFLVSGTPIGLVQDHEIALAYSQLGHDPDALKASLEQDLASIEKYLDWVRIDVKPFNEALPETVRKRIDTRRERLLADRGLAASLGYQMRVRSDAPKTYVVPTRRRKRPIQRSGGGAVEPFRPEPELLEEEYKHILGILASMVDVIERSPEAFRQMKEEHLRDQFLVQLNGHYEGSATGEMFNFEGKTDILIREKGRNIFIAECKFWHGRRRHSRTPSTSCSATSRGATRRRQSSSSTER